jgi:15-cis-phytoene synthase
MSSTTTPQISLLRLPYQMLRPMYERTSIHTRVIDEISDVSLRSAYSHCRHITRHHAKTFYLATRFLPNPKQRSIFAIYALCRYMDDLIDEQEDLVSFTKVDASQLDELMRRFRSDLTRTYRYGADGHPILQAFADTLTSYHIPMQYPLELLEGVCMDLAKNRYDTFGELRSYCYKVASVVGLMTSEVFGYDNPAAIEHAIDLGIAMQLTNILRDVGEDLTRNRIYLPKEDLDRFGLDESDLHRHVSDDRFHALMRFQIERARSFYDSADKGIPMLSADSRLPVILARENYSRILDVIEREPAMVYKRRAFLSTTQKLRILPKAAWRAARG